MSEREEHDAPRVVPVAEEQIRVEKRERVRARVRLAKRVRTEPVRVRHALAAEEIVVERVPVGRFVERPPEPHYDGDTLVLPVVEEVLVTQVRLRLREEVRITRRTTRRTEVVDGERRVEELDVERLEEPDAGPGGRGRD